MLENGDTGVIEVKVWVECRTSNQYFTVPGLMMREREPTATVML